MAGPVDLKKSANSLTLSSLALASRATPACECDADGLEGTFACEIGCAGLANSGGSALFVVFERSPLSPLSGTFERLDNVRAVSLS